MQIAFGPIVAAYLVVQGWRAEDIGFTFSMGRHCQFGQSGAWRRARG
jgi:hypothetical protein